MSQAEDTFSDTESVEFFFESDDEDSQIDNNDVDESDGERTKRVSSRSRLEEFTTLEERIRKMVEIKGLKLLGDETRWREEVRQQMESELNRRVREALDTPPLERSRKRTDAESQQSYAPDINARLLFDPRDQDRGFLRARRWGSRQDSNQSHTGDLVAIHAGSKQLRYLLPDELYHSNPELRSAEFTQGAHVPYKYKASVSRFPDLKSKAYSFYTKRELARCHREGRLAVGVEVSDAGEKYLDKFGVVRTDDGPFWPAEAVPLFGTPRFKWWVVATPEPLYEYQAWFNMYRSIGIPNSSGIRMVISQFREYSIQPLNVVRTRYPGIVSRNRATGYRFHAAYLRCQHQGRSKSLYISRIDQDVNAPSYVGHLSYTDQLEAFISRFKRRPADIKYWPYGPYWPGHFEGLLLNTPRHLVVGLHGCEPLAVGEYGRHLFANSQTTETQETQYPGKWRGVQVAYDSDRSPRDCNPLPVPEGCCPTLMFESRFECGNLRQARRVNQFEYELVLKADLYTARHTQWYYFRVTNAVPGVTYKIRIVNLLKKDSLYNHGMRPLLYSEQDAKERQRGWVRTGHHISYTRSSSVASCPMLEKGIIYYTLEWQMEFPNSQDTYYLAHCYPYSFTDLTEDLELLMNCEERAKVTRREVMCETRAGNSCFLLTITNFDSTGEKRAVVITARVHPGESQSSWMMKGLLEFITGPDPVAKELRNKFVFKVVPMINPDGVIVGNYRCSLVGRDLNRNYRHPRQESFPSIWYIKHMVHNLAKKYEIALYCDLHGHSRKPNVFMYGNNASADLGATPHDLAKAFISERLFPWIMSLKSPNKFHFRSCKFQIRRCKESTGRVVMWRQMRVANSFTMEATFSGTVLDRDNCRHFNTRDFMDMGQELAQAILEYQAVREDPVQHTQTVLGLTRCVTERILTCKGVLGSNTSPPNVLYQGNGETNKPAFSADAILALIKHSNTIQVGQSPTAGVASPDKQRQKDGCERQVSVAAAPLPRDELLQIAQKLAAGRTMDDCVEVLARLDVQHNLQESDSSDSDSESEPEMTPPEPKARKKRKKSKKQRDKETERKTSQGEKKKVDIGRAKSSAHHLPELGRVQMNGETRRSSQRMPWFVSKYDGRHNGGFPCFTEERSLERAAKRQADHKVKQTDRRTSEDSVSEVVDECSCLALGVSGYRHGVVDGKSNTSPAQVDLSVKTCYTHSGNLQDQYPHKCEPWEEARGHWKYTHSALGHHHSNGHQHQRPGDCNNNINDNTSPNSGLKLPLTARRHLHNQLQHGNCGSQLESPFVQHAYVSPHPSWSASAAASSPAPAVSASRNRITHTDNATLFTNGAFSLSTSGNKPNSSFTINNLSTKSSAVASSPQPRSSPPTEQRQQNNSSKLRQKEPANETACPSDNSKNNQDSDAEYVTSDEQTVVDRKTCSDDQLRVVLRDNEGGSRQRNNLLTINVKREKLNVGQLVNNLERNLTSRSPLLGLTSLPSHNHNSRSTDQRSVASASSQVSPTPLLTTTALVPNTRAALTDNLALKDARQGQGWK